MASIGAIHHWQMYSFALMVGVSSRLWRMRKRPNFSLDRSVICYANRTWSYWASHFYGKPKICARHATYLKKKRSLTIKIFVILNSAIGFCAGNIAAWLHKTASPRSTRCNTCWKHLVAGAFHSLTWGVMTCNKLPLSYLAGMYSAFINY